MDEPKLPRKMSELLRMAVEDAKKIERTPGYALDMNVYHVGGRDGATCHVCMAGAVMSCRLGVERSRDACAADFDAETVTALIAIDSMRRGWFSLAAQQLGVQSVDSRVLDAATDAVGYYRADNMIGRSDWRSSWRSYEDAADILESHGL